MDLDELTDAFHALGDPTRARILVYLLECCEGAEGTVAVDEGGAVSRIEGATAGAVCCHLTGEGRVNSTVSFHLKELRSAGLIHMERRGRHMVCRPNREALARLATFFERAARGGACCRGGC